MAPASRSSWPGLAAILLLLLCLLNFTTASPVPDNHEPEHKTLNKRASITQARYEAYLKKYFPATNRYMLYTGNSETQLKFFQSKNKASGYLYYADLFNVPQSDIDEPDVKKRKHPWWKAFDEDNDMDDGEASSKALANLASGDVLIFGGIEYKTEGANSFFTRQEIDLLHAGLRSGRIKSLKHMAKDAKSTSDVIATEDANGVLTFIPPATAATKNAGRCALTKRAGSSCYGPKKPNSKKTSKCGSGKSKSKTGKGKRATASDAACPMPSARPTATKTTKAPVASATRKATKPTATKKPTTKKPTTKKPKKKVL